MTRLPILSLLLAAAPAAAEVVPLAHGTYVASDTACADPPLAFMRDYDGRGFPTPHSRDCRARIVAHRGTSYTLANDCIGAGEGPAPRTTETLRIRIAVRTRFVFLDEKRPYRLCIPAALPPSLRHRARR